jgi:uncharacterized protein affecting Mg2+/Co2+ transport
MTKSTSLYGDTGSSFLMYEKHDKKTEIFSKIKHKIEISISFVYVKSQSQEYAQIWIYKLNIHNMRKRVINFTGAQLKIVDCYGLNQEMSTLHPLFQEIVIQPGAFFKHMGHLCVVSSYCILMGRCEFRSSRHHTFGIDMPKVFLDTKSNGGRDHFLNSSIIPW